MWTRVDTARCGVVTFRSPWCFGYVGSPSKSDGGGGRNRAAIEAIVDYNFGQAEIAKFCFTVEQVGYGDALRAFKSAHTMPLLSIEAVFREIVRRCA